MAIYLARDLSGLSCKNLGEYFDGISGAAITIKYRQINKEIVSDKSLSHKITKIKEQLLNI